MKKEDYRLKKLLKKFVNIYAYIPDVQLDWKKTVPKLWFMPPATRPAKKQAAHYFLLAAAINETKVIGNARNVRVLLCCLHEKLHERFFTIQDPSEFEDEVTSCQSTCKLFGQFGPKKVKIANILASVNRFVNNKAKGDLIKYAKDLSTNGGKPQDMVEKLAYSMGAMGGRHRGKSWLYMRWMVRDKPDLRLFKSFKPRDLLVPLTTPTLRVAVALKLVDEEVVEALQSAERIEDWWQHDHEEQKGARIALTDYAKTLFRNDPARVDHAFFVLGRWLSSFDLNKEVLIQSLEFFNKKYDEIRTPPIKYLVVFPHEYRSGIGASGSVERCVAEMLNKKRIRFEYEPIEFRLPKINSGPPTYKPDLILPKRIGEKKVFLEPHGNYENIKQQLTKWSLFRETYGEYCFLIVIAPDGLVKLIHEIPNEKEAYDCLWKISDFSKELDRLLKGEESPKTHGARYMKALNCQLVLEITRVNGLQRIKVVLGDNCGVALAW